MRNAALLLLYMGCIWLSDSAVCADGSTAVQASPPAAVAAGARPLAPAAEAQRAGASALRVTAETNGPPGATREQHVIEVTFGNSQLFIHQSVVVPKENGTKTRVIPVSSALLMAEWLFHPRLSLLGAFLLPLETQKTLRNGQLFEEYAAPSVALGMRASALGIDVLRASKLELQLGALCGVALGSEARYPVYPLVSGRIHFSTGSGFAQYLGGAFAFGKDTIALIYGVGHRF